MGSKSELRSHFKKKLDALSGDRQAKSHLVCSQVERLFREQNFFSHLTYLGVFDPLGDEVDWKSLNLPTSIKCVYPRFIESGVMDYAELSKEDGSYSHSFGVKLMSPSLRFPSITPDIVLVPGLAFDNKGFRLGRGAGFYDRYLSCFKGVSIGVIFNECLTEELPKESYDVPVDYVVSEKGFYKGSNKIGEK